MGIGLSGKQEVCFLNVQFL